MIMPTSAQYHQTKDIQYNFAAQAVKSAALATVCICVCFCWWGLPCTFISIALGVKVSAPVSILMPRSAITKQYLVWMHGPNAISMKFFEAISYGLQF